ncbi:hypothetical protein [Nocardia camponoti]|nr:hypothetical protein [Nocardia camponoti]
MREVTSAAGLRDDWDKMLVATPGVKGPELEAGLGGTKVCWKNLPRSYNDDVPQTAYYLFARGGKPLQAVRWLFPTDKEFDSSVTRSSVLTPETMLVPVKVPGVEPCLKLAEQP